MLVGSLWWTCGTKACVVIGNVAKGYVVMPATAELAAELEADAKADQCPMTTLHA